MNTTTRQSFESKLEDTAARLKSGAAALGARLGDAAGKSGLNQAGARIADPPMVDPARFKNLLITALKLLVVIELISAFLQGVNTQSWGRFGIDLIIAGVLYVTWGRITALLRSRKELSRRKMESGADSIRLWDALIFSVLWSDEIHNEIPQDRRRLVVISYTLIALGVVAAFLQIGSGLMPLVITGVLVLGAVNLLVWVVSLERGERESLETELRLARDVQLSLMPKAHPSVTGYDIAGFASPASEVGGDLFQYAWLGGDTTAFGISVFDVSGKGMQAAMAAVFTSGALASEARVTPSPGEILTRLNRAVYEHSRRGQFVAFLMASLDLKGRAVSFANAGQTKPLFRSRGCVQWLDSVGVHFPLGMKDDALFTERDMPLESGDVLVLLTDGFTDAMNPQRELFGQERLQRILERPDLANRSAQEILDAFVTEARRFAADTPQHDDMTMVVVRVT
jgi:serine phosphatase RsbU (regulator of sigma subunit)